MFNPNLPIVPTTGTTGSSTGLTGSTGSTGTTSVITVSNLTSGLQSATSGDLLSKTESAGTVPLAIILGVVLGVICLSTVTAVLVLVRYVLCIGQMYSLPI